MTETLTQRAERLASDLDAFGMADYADTVNELAAANEALRQVVKDTTEKWQDDRDRRAGSAGGTAR